MQTGIDIVDGECWISTDNRALSNRLRKMMEESGEGKVIRTPEENDGVLYVHVPAEWVHIGKKRKLELTEEQRAERSERLRRIRNGEW